MTDEAEGAAEPAPGPEPPPGLRRWLPWALVVVFAIAAVVMTWVAASLEQDLDEARSGDSDVARVAGEFSQAFFTLDYREPERWHDEVVALATGTFRDEYEEAFEGGLDTLMEQTRPVWTVTIDEVLVGDVEEGRANAVTVVDISQDGAGGRREIPNAYVRLGLVRVEGEWRIDSVTYPKATDPVPLDPATGSSSTTTAP